MHSDFGALRAQCSMNCGIRVRLNEISPALKRDIDRISELWNEGVTRFGGPFLAGETFTAVNAFFAPVAFRIQTYSLMLDEVLTSYAKRLLALPSMQSWYNDALVEPWRESDHEAEAKQAGTLIEDLRTAVS
jgi:glutathione S-transferase